MTSEKVAWSDANLREIARLRTALTNAQRLADHYRALADTQRAQLDAAQAEHAALRRWLRMAVAAWKAERAKRRRLHAWHVKAVVQFAHEAAEHNMRTKALTAALRGLLADPYGCPMCDSGELRNPTKAHWMECPYAVARALVGSEDDHATR